MTKTEKYTEMPTNDDAIIEATARALCSAHGFDPDHVAPATCVSLPGLDNKGQPRERIEVNDKPRWMSWTTNARAHLAAHRAMLKAENSG